jgi:quercetin dioxygenase-like cupin family protein
VLKGSVWLKAGSEAWQGKSGDLLIVPNGLHSLEAEEDSAVLFTVVKTDR